VVLNHNINMKSQFVRIYLRFVAVVLSVTAVAKLPAVLLGVVPNLCMEKPLFGRVQPFPNFAVLGIAAIIEFSIVMLICLSPWRRLQCLVSALWGSICLAARAYFIISGVDCGCLGWLAKPGPMTNMIASILALALAAGGYVAFYVNRRDSCIVPPSPLHV